jgi:hypothetical protein
MTSERRDCTLLGGLLAAAVAAPMALALESLLRAALLPPDFELLREAWGPRVTPWVWRLVPVAAVSDAAAFALQLHLQKRATTLATARQRRWKRFEGLMISASVAQIPGFLAAVAFLVGADLGAVLACVGISTAGVMVLGVTLQWS